MTGVTTDLEVVMGCSTAGLIVDASRVLALEVWRENRVDGAAVNMTGILEAMVRLGMNVDERNREHPPDQPRHHDGTGAVHFRYRCNYSNFHGMRLSQGSQRVNQTSERPACPPWLLGTQTLDSVPWYRV